MKKPSFPKSYLLRVFHPHFESFASEHEVFECSIRSTKGSFASEHKVFEIFDTEQPKKYEGWRMEFSTFSINENNIFIKVEER